MRPKTRYEKCGYLDIACQVAGSRALDIIHSDTIYPKGSEAALCAAG